MCLLPRNCFKHGGNLREKIMYFLMWSFCVVVFCTFINQTSGDSFSCEETCASLNTGCTGGTGAFLCPQFFPLVAALHMEDGGERLWPKDCGLLPLFIFLLQILTALLPRSPKASLELRNFTSFLSLTFFSWLPTMVALVVFVFITLPCGFSFVCLWCNEGREDGGRWLTGGRKSRR